LNISDLGLLFAKLVIYQLFPPILQQSMCQKPEQQLVPKRWFRTLIFTNAPLGSLEGNVVISPLRGSSPTHC